MIPADVASRLQVSSDAALRPVAPTQEISDKLAGLVAGQKVMAEIQAMLPNGTYRAIINQRNVTLALPFSAKTGDSLELQVTESDGKLALAILSQQSSGGKSAPESVSATLSKTGQLISNLYSGTQESKGQSTALPLNANQPIAAAPPENANDLVPLLKQAIAQSGMFYESHQAEWVEGRMPKTDLLQEPQGKHSSPAAFTAASASEQTARTVTANEILTNLRPASENTASTAPNTAADAAKSATLPPGQTIAPQLQSLVQQQLEALATQNFSWQGQVWPGQEMRWEIDENAARNPQEDDDTAPRWATHLRMTLPRLGEIDARIQLHGNQISLSMSAGTGETRDLMRASGTLLRGQLDDAGLTLTTMGVDAIQSEESHGET